MKTFAKIMAAALVVACSLTTFAQSVGTGITGGKYSTIPVPLPTGAYTTPFTNNYGVSNTVPYYLAGTTVSNIVAGWTSTNLTTNVTIVWTNSGGTGFNGTFVTNTVVTTNIGTTYPNFAALVNRNTGL